MDVNSSVPMFNTTRITGDNWFDGANTSAVQFYTTYPVISNIFYLIAGIQWVLVGELTAGLIFFIVTVMSSTYHVCFMFDHCRQLAISTDLRLSDHMTANTALLASLLVFTDFSQSKNWSIIVAVVLSFAAVIVVMLDKFSPIVAILLQVVFLGLIFIRYVIFGKKTDLKLVYLTLFRKKTLLIAILTGIVGIFFFFSVIDADPFAAYNNIGHAHWHVYSSVAASLLALARRIKTIELWHKHKSVTVPLN